MCLVLIQNGIFFYTCNITLDQFTVTNPLVSPGDDMLLNVPVTLKVGVINENNLFCHSLVLLSPVTTNGLTQNGRGSNHSI
jgi:hypothetical protein